MMSRLLVWKQTYKRMHSDHRNAFRHAGGGFFCIKASVAPHPPHSDSQHHMADARLSCATRGPHRGCTRAPAIVVHPPSFNARPASSAEGTAATYGSPHSRMPPDQNQSPKETHPAVPPHAACAGYVDTLSGGSISKLGIFSLGIIPYINASIIIQLAVQLNPELKKIQREVVRAL